MANRVITISRQFGSGGRTVGRMTAMKLGIPCYDQELIQKVAEESGFAERYIQERGEELSSGGWLAAAFTDREYNGLSLQDSLWLEQRNVILDLAKKGPCVIVGRCADFILRDEADCLKAFIHADMKQRAERIVTQYGERAVSPEKRLKDKDKRRAAYYQFYTDMRWGAVENYDISLDSGTFGIEKCAEILASLY